MPYTGGMEIGMKKEKIGFFVNGDYRGLSCDKVFEDLSRIGYEAVEFPYCPEEGAEGLKIRNSAATAAGLTISEVVCQRDYVVLEEELRKKNIETTLSCIRDCAEAGVETVNLFTGPVPWGPAPLCVGSGISAGDAWNMLYEALDLLVPEAERCGVNLAVENVWGHLCHDFFTMEHLVSRYNSQRMGVNFDPSHDLLSGNTDMCFLITAWGKERIKHVHLKDAVGVMCRGKFNFPLLGEGLVDWEGFREGLQRIGYDGVLSVEFESDGYLARYCDGDLSEAARLSRQAISKIFKL